MPESSTHSEAGAALDAPLPINEWQRLTTLRRYQILDTLPEQAFDDLVRLTAHACAAPIAAISLVDANRQWFKARVGLGLQETSRHLSFCSHAILYPDKLLVVSDTLEDDRFRANDLVTNAPHIRFYAGAPLVMADGMVLGTLCIMDTVPRNLTEHQRTALQTLRRSVVNEIELRAVTTDADIIERKHAEEALRESQASLQTFLDTASDLIQSLDAAGIIRYVNMAWCTTLGYTTDEAYGRPVFDIIDPSSHDHCRAVLRAMLESGQAQQLEVIFRAKAGQVVVVEGNISVRKRDDGNVTTYGIFRDITRRKQTEEALRIANVEMERALRMKDKFLANMSHELRTPLNTILSLGEIMLEGIYDPLTERQQIALHRIEASSQHLLALINDILDLSKFEAGQLDLHIEPIDVIDICQISLQFVKELALKKQLRLSSRLPDALGIIEADAKRLKQMLVNLLSNAVKFTPSGGTVRLEVQVEPQSGIISFAVRDTGIGIAPHDLTRLFQPFVQVDSSVNRQQEGTGLGLALVRHLAELHGGAITVESEVGTGSCFTIILPYREPEVVSLAEPPASPAEAPPARRMPGDERPERDSGAYPMRAPMSGNILLVDDSEDSLASTLAYLQAKGYQVTVARNGYQALDLAEQICPDIILLDIQMPELDGIETARRLRSRPVTATIPIIALTALAMPGDRERCLAAGVDDYLSKPVRLSHLVIRIEQLRRTISYGTDTNPTTDY